MNLTESGSRNDAALVKQGDVLAIASLLNASDYGQQLTIRVWQQDGLCVLIEAPVVPDQPKTMTWLHENLMHLDLDPTQPVRVYARQRGQHLPAWRKELSLIPSIHPDAALLSFADWLNQGTEHTSSPPRALTAFSNQPNTGSNQDSIPAHPGQTTPFLRFHLNAHDIALLPLAHVQEVHTVSGDSILPVPNLPDAVLGVYNRRGEMVWLVDLAKHLHVSLQSTLPGSAAMTIVVIQVEEKSLGLFVSRVIGMETYDVQCIQPAAIGLVSPTLLPFVQGYLLGSESRSTSHLILNAPALIASVAQLSHPGLGASLRSVEI